MGRSIQVEPPKGSELAARVDSFSISCPEEFVFEDEAVEEFRAVGVLRDDPRIWKHPPKLIARYYLPYYLSALGDEIAAHQCAENEALALRYARDLQEKAKYEATEAERRKEPSNPAKFYVPLLVLIEVLNVKCSLPQASMNKCFEVTGKRLGARGQPLSRSAIRSAYLRGLDVFNQLHRAVQKIEKKEGRPSDPPYEFAVNFLFHLGRMFTPGWRDRLAAEG